jgi:hypothetical protein
MPLPAAIPLAKLLASGVGALGVGEGVKEVLKNIPQGDNTQLEDTFKRLFLGPSVLPRTIDTPSGKVFAPDEPTPAKPDILATYPPSKDQPWIMSSPIPAGEPKGLMGLPIPETQDKLKGFEKPQDVDTSVLMQNKIKTWEHLTPDINKAEELAKNNNIDFKELEKLAIKDQITFKPKGGAGYDIYFDGKFIGELDNITKATSGEVPKNKYGDAYNINLIDRSLNTLNVDTQNGLNYSKEHSKDMIANSLLDLDKNNEYSLRSFFPDIKYDKKGNIIQEEITSNPVGSLIDKPLSDETN